MLKKLLILKIISVFHTSYIAVTAGGWIRNFNFYTQRQRLDKESSNSRLEELHFALSRRRALHHSSSYLLHSQKSSSSFLARSAKSHRLHSAKLGVLWN